MSSCFADLHCHSTMFAFNELKRIAWHQHRWLIYHSQGDFIKLSKGGVRVLFLSLYPVEQGFLTVKRYGLGTGNISDFMAHSIVNMPKERADKIQSYEHNYFDDLLKEYKFLQGSVANIKRIHLKWLKWKKFKYKIVSNFNELNTILYLDPDLNPKPSSPDDTIAVILTIEGAHSLGVGQRNTLGLHYKDLSSTIVENIKELKAMGPPGSEGLHCPFFISLSHHFWNQLGGHAVSIPGKKTKYFDQNQGINKGIKKLGKLALDELLSIKNGKRILIDVAHMSVKLRQWFYYEYLPQREERTGNRIPVIASHTGVNGFATMAESELPGTPDVIHEVADYRYKTSTKFNPWDLLRSDEEIMIIHNSGGLIGLNLDKRIMMGNGVLKTTKRRAENKPWRAKTIWTEPLIEEILHIAKLIYSETGRKKGIWDNICIGSDYDGLINPIKAFPSAKHFPQLDKMIFKQLEKKRPTEPILKGYSDSEIREITDKIVWKNALGFLKKNYN